MKTKEEIKKEIKEIISEHGVNFILEIVSEHVKEVERKYQLNKEESTKAENYYHEYFKKIITETN